MSSSDPQPPVDHGGPRSSRTQEIPVVQPSSGATAMQLPPHPNATTPASVRPVDAPVPTGPVDFVPGLPGAGTPPPPPVPPTPVPPVAADPLTPAAEPQGPDTAESPAPVWPDTLLSDEPDRKHRSAKVRPPRDRTALVGLGLTALSLGLLELGLLLRDGDQGSYWQGIPLWSGFATLCALLGLAAFASFFPAGKRLRSGPAGRVAAAGLVGLAVFWLLVVLPVVATDRGFLLTAALAALGGALWVGSRRKG